MKGHSHNFLQVLIGGVKPENIFWAVSAAIPNLLASPLIIALQVAGGVALGTSSKIQGIVSSQTKMFLDTKTTVIGRLYAQTAVSHLLWEIR